MARPVAESVITNNDCLQLFRHVLLRILLNVLNQRSRHEQYRVWRFQQLLLYELQRSGEVARFVVACVSGLMPEVFVTVMVVPVSCCHLQEFPKHVMSLFVRKSFQEAVARDFARQTCGYEW